MRDTSAPTVPHSSNRFQVTSVLIEQGIQVHSRSQNPAVNVGIYYANQTTRQLWEQVFLIRYLVGKVFCILTKSWKAKKILPKFIIVNKN